MPAVLFVNPLAGGGSAGRKVAEARAAFERRNYSVKIEEPGSAEELRKSARAAIDGGCTTLIALGGDGTMRLAAREAIGRDVRVGVIPAGGGNDFAAALRIPRNVKQAVEVIARGNTRAVDAVCVRTETGEDTVYLGGGGIGLDARAAQFASKRYVTWPGRLRYVASALAALQGYSGIEVEAEFPGSDLPKITKKVLLAAVLNSPTYGGGLCLAPEAQVDDGMVEVVMIEMLRKREVLALLPRLLITGELKSNRVVRFRVSRVRLAAGHGTWFHGDGELLGVAPVEIRVLPKALRVLVP
jgi:diacylglycerol kinase (ATP)